VERYYNKGRFIKTLLYITSGFFSSAFEFYRSFAQYNIKNGYLERPLAARELYNVLTDYIEENFSTRNSYIRDLMKLDFLSSDSSGNLPVCLARNYEPGFKDKCLNFLKNSEYIEKYLPEYKGLPPVQIYKQVHFELFRHDITSVNEIYEKDSCILLFDYSRRDRVTGLYTYFQVNF
ncbi:MAG: DUF4080 domain-containing protein, partial [Bacillota bacterium]|nr:DUF4080 domain-containing protein [Bacillota bacterium]